jgi:hypothetical protein
MRLCSATNGRSPPHGESPTIGSLARDFLASSAVGKTQLIEPIFDGSSDSALPEGNDVSIAIAHEQLSHVIDPINRSFDNIGFFARSSAAS